MNTSCEEALRHFLSAAERNSALAHLNLASFGPKAARYSHLHKAADQKLQRAQVTLAACVFDEQGIRINDVERFNRLKACADNYSSPSINEELASFYFYGDGVQTNDEKALEYALKSENPFYPKCYDIIGRICAVNHDLPLAFSYYRDGAELSDVECLYKLSICYLYGKGIKVNNPKGLIYLTRAAEGGHAKAQYYLGLQYKNGSLGLDPSDARAYHYFTLAAAKKLPEAQFEVGEFHHNQLIPEASREVARSYYQLSAAQGFAPAQEALAQLEEV